MLRKFTVSLLLLLCVSYISKAQNTIVTNLHEQVGGYYSAANLADDSLSITAYNRYLPTASAGMNSNRLFFVGSAFKLDNVSGQFQVNYALESFSFLSRHRVMFGYSRTFTKGNHKVALGARIGGDINRIALTELSYDGIGGDKTNFRPDADFGISYGFRKLKVGLGFNQLLSPSSKIDGIEYVSNPTSANLRTSYLFGFKNDWFVKPSVLLLQQEYLESMMVIGFGKQGLFESGVSVQLPPTTNLVWLFGLDLGFYAGINIKDKYSIYTSLEKHALSEAYRLDVTLRINLK